jgi:hypothetical protein
MLYCFPCRDDRDVMWTPISADKSSDVMTTHTTLQGNIDLPDPGVGGTVSVVLVNVCRSEGLVVMHGDQPKAVGLHILPGLFPFKDTPGDKSRGSDELPPDSLCLNCEQLFLWLSMLKWETSVAYGRNYACECISQLWVQEPSLILHRIMQGTKGSATLLL